MTDQTLPQSRGDEGQPWKLDTEQVPMDAFAHKVNSDEGEWYRVPSWRVYFDSDELRGFDFRLHRSIDSQAVWTLSEATTGCRIFGDIPHQFYMGDETAMLAEFCAGMMKRITRQSMIEQIEKARARQLPPRPYAPSETKAKWRPVSEKPPCANQYIALIALPDCDEPRVAQRYYSMTGKWDSDYVTHWMPFPEAP